MMDEARSSLDVTEHHDEHGGYELRLVGEVDQSSLPTLTAHVERVLAAVPSKVAFELSGVSFMDSSGIGVLIEVAGAVPEITLVNPSAPVLRLVQLCGLTPILPVTALSTTS